MNRTDTLTQQQHNKESQVNSTKSTQTRNVMYVKNIPMLKVNL